MKHLLTALLLIGVSVAFAGPPKVADCFKVHALVKVDDDHYGADWTNACPYTIDSVYVTVGFTDRSGQDVGTGVWALHFVTPRTHRLNRFTVPAKVVDFESVRARKITTDLLEALRKP